MTYCDSHLVDPPTDERPWKGSLADTRDRLRVAIAGLQLIRSMVGEGGAIARVIDAVTYSVGEEL